MRPAGTREYKNYAECKDVSLYSAEVESFRAERGSGSDKRSVSDSLYDDVQHLGFRGVRGDRFLTYPNRAGSLETCGFKQRFWSLLGLRPKVSRASEGGSPPRPCGSGGRVPVPRRGRRSRRPHFFQQRKKWGKERRQKPMVFGFPLPDLNAAGKGSTGNRPRVYPRCR